MKSPVDTHLFSQLKTRPWARTQTGTYHLRVWSSLEAHSTFEVRITWSYTNIFAYVAYDMIINVTGSKTAVSAIFWFIMPVSSSIVAMEPFVLLSSLSLKLCTSQKLIPNIIILLQIRVQAITATCLLLLREVAASCHSRDRHAVTQVLFLGQELSFCQDFLPSNQNQSCFWILVQLTLP